MRVVSFNLLCGAHDPPERWGRIVALLRQLEPDLLLLQECMDWDQARIETLGRELGLDHAFLTIANPRGSGRRYNLGALCRWAVSGRSPVHPKLAHGLQEITLEGLAFYNLHLCAGSEAERLDEVEYVLSQIGKGGVLMGDLNALSPLDPYEAETAQRLWGAGCQKYGSPFSFRVMERLFEAGWREPERLGPDWVTRWRTETDPPTGTRTDYALVCGEVAISRANGYQVHPLHHEESDHCPLLLLLDQKKTG